MKSLIMDNQAFHSLIIKSFHNQTVSLPCQHINLGMFPWIVLEKTSGDKELGIHGFQKGKIQNCQTSVENGRKFLIHQFTFLEPPIFFGPKNEFSSHTVKFLRSVHPCFRICKTVWREGSSVWRAVSAEYHFKQQLLIQVARHVNCNKKQQLKKLEGKVRGQCSDLLQQKRRHWTTDPLLV